MLIVTTAIPGSDRKGYLDSFSVYCRNQKKKVKIYHVGQMFFEYSERVGINLTKEYVLNANPAVLRAVRSAVFEGILAELPTELKKNDTVFINIHSLFYWKKVFSRSLDRFYLSKLNPDLFINFVDMDANETRERLSKRKQWQREKLTLEEVLLWQNVEAEMTAAWAEINNKPFCVLDVNQPVSTLYRLIFHPEIETVYISMPMTHLRSRADRQKIDKFIKELDKYFVVFEPRILKLSGLGSKMNLIVYHQGAYRDMHWLIRQSKKLIAYFPKIVSSPGVINEMREAHETNKDVWLVYSAKSISPFMTYYCNQIFESPAELFKFLKKYRPSKNKK